MTNFFYDTAEEIKETRFGGYLLELVELLALPIPTIKGSQLKKFNKEGLWGIKLQQSGRETEPKTEDIEIKSLSDSKEKGINLAMQDLIARLCEVHRRELKDHYFFILGRRDEDGLPVPLDEETKHKYDRTFQFLQDLESHLHDLKEDRHTELWENDELRAQLKEMEKKIKAQEDAASAQEEKFQVQEKKLENQEKRVKEKNKKIRDLKAELEGNNVEFEADHDLIEKLRGEKRKLQEANEALENEVKKLKTVLATNEALENEVKELKTILATEGITIEEEEVEEEEGAMVEV